MLEVSFVEGPVMVHYLLGIMFQKVREGYEQIQGS